MNDHPVTRRQALRAAALLPLALGRFGAVRLAAADDPSGASVPSKEARLKLGLASYSLRQLPLDAAIEVMRGLQLRSASVYRSHVPIEGGKPEECRAAAEKFREAGISLASTGVVHFSKDQAAARRAFENASAAGLPLITCALSERSNPELFSMLEGLVKEYGIRLAIHNHGPEDRIYPSPYDVWKDVGTRDGSIGLCLDVGHAVRAGADPVEAIRRCHTRLYDLHLKDTNAVAGDRKDHAVEMGYGRVDIRAVLAALIEVGYTGQTGLEDEVATTDPEPGVCDSYGYMRGVLAGIPA